MKISELDVSLYCSRCKDETLHRVQYLNEKLHSTECSDCHRKYKINFNPTRELYKEVYKRITSKPTRVTKEYKEDLSKFISGFPKRLLSKPYRLLRNVDETMKAFKKLKDRE
jgi:ribosomal protein L44E